MDEVSVPPSVERFLNLRYATTKRAWSPELGFHQVDCAPRMVEGMGRDFMRRLRHKRHGQNQHWQIREMVHKLQLYPEVLAFAAKEMHVALPDVGGIPAFGEKYCNWLQERKDRKLRNIQKRSRKCNRKHL